MKIASTNQDKRGFTLVEVSLAVLVVGLGLLSLFGLFPSGLRAGEEAATDTRAGLFASVVLDGMLANASEIKTWAEWNDGAPGVGSTLNSTLCASLLDVGTIVADGNIQPKIEFPKNSSKFIRYSLSIGRPSDSRLCSACLRVWERTGTAYSEFYSEFVFRGR